MSKPPPQGGADHSVLDDAVTVPRARPQPGAGGEPSAFVLSVSDLQDVPRGSLEPDASLLIGKTISDRYVVHELIGHGGMGAVYRGEQVHLRKRVAIKVLRPDKARLVELAARFEREAVAGAHVNHPNVVAAIDFGKLEDGTQFLIQEYVEGTPLKDLIQSGPLPVDRAVSFARQLAQALVAVHEKSIVHRDIKPQNILIDARDHVKLIDFGLAKVRLDLLSEATRSARANAPLTAQGIVMGTFAYMAPEALRGMEAVDARSDLYALGVVTYEMLAGKRPFEERDPVLLLKQVRSEDAPPLQKRAPEVSVPAQIEAVVMRLLEREPDRRFQSALDLCAALDQAVAASQPAGKKGAALPPQAAAALPVKAAAPSAKEAAPPGPDVVSRLASKLPPKLLEKRSVIVITAGLSALTVILLILVAFTGGSSDQEHAESTPSTASAAPPPPAPAPPPANVPIEIDGMDATEWAENLRRSAGRREWRAGAKAFLALARLDPARLTGPEIRTEVVAVVAGIGLESTLPETKQIFEALENELGPGGLDVLFDVMRTRGGTKAARRAKDILSKQGTMPRATPGLRIAFELRTASCTDKPTLFPRAAEEGDDRALDELLIAKDARCSSSRDPCCFREDMALKDTIAKLRARLGK